METEHDNVRAAIEWAQQNHESTPAMLLVGQLWLFWFLFHPSEGLEHTATVLSLPEAAPSVARIYALNCEGFLQFFEGNYIAARRALDEGLTIAKAVNDKRLIATTMTWLGQVTGAQQDHAVAGAYLAEALDS